MIEKKGLIQPIYDESVITSIEVSLGSIRKKDTGEFIKPFECFFKDMESVRIKVRTEDISEHILKAKEYFATMMFVGDVAYDPTRSFQTEEPNHKEIFMAKNKTGGYVQNPQLVYTRDINTCLGIGFYNETLKKGSLFHIAGAEQSSINNLKEIVDTEFSRLGKGLKLIFVSGLATISNESLLEVQNAREESLNYLAKNNAYIKNLQLSLSEIIGEYISYLSLDSKTGLYGVEKKTLSMDRLFKMDRETDESMRLKQQFCK